jgi:hypothetical protein
MGHPEAKASLAPILVAMAILASIGLLGLAVAWWPGEQPAEAQELRNGAAPGNPSSFGGDGAALPRGGPQPKWI